MKEDPTPYEQYTEFTPARGCCKALTPTCMACLSGLSVEDYCNKNPGKHGCAKAGCNPQTGPSSVGCSNPKCGACPPGKNCRYVTEYRDSGGKCCPIPCNRIETDKSCPDAGRGYGTCNHNPRPVDTDEHKFVASSPTWVKSGNSCCKVINYTRVDRTDQICCKAMTKECLACQAGLTLGAFCEKPENSTYCHDYKQTTSTTIPSTAIPTPSTITPELLAEEYLVERINISEFDITIPSLIEIVSGLVSIGIMFMLFYHYNKGRKSKKST